MKLYRQLLGRNPDDHLMDEEILTYCDEPSPTELLRRARLRYLGTLYAGASHLDWGIINHDQEWLTLVQDDCMWLWTQLHHCSALRDPRTHFPAWEYILRYHSTFWKRLVNRGCRHAMLQRRNRVLMGQLHRRIFHSLCHHGVLGVAEPVYEKTFDQQTRFGCMLCGIRCASKGGEGAHFFKKHQVVASVRRFCEDTQCPHCLREYHTRSHLQRHLQRSADCRGVLHARRLSCPVVAGIGSSDQRAAQRLHDGLLPPLQAQGPALPVPVPQAPDPEDADLIERWMSHFEALPDRESLLGAFEKEILCTPISWTRCQLTLAAFRSGYTDELADITGVASSIVFSVIDTLSDADHWPFLRIDSSQQDRPVDELDHYTTWCERLIAGESIWTMSSIPGPVGRDRIVLHVFAGRRRAGDFQWFLEELMAPVEGREPPCRVPGHHY